MEKGIRMKIWRNLLIAGSLIASLLPGSGWAWKIPTHVGTANHVLDDFSPTGSSPITSGPGTDVVRFQDPLSGRHLELEVSQKEAYQAITFWPLHFRAGVIGPDGFPDLGTGQFLQHSNMASYVWKASDWLKDEGRLPPTYENPPPLEALIKYESRTVPSQFRSIDHAMAMFAYFRGEYQSHPRGAPSAAENQQILAFIIGYIAHCVGDAFAHTWINELVGGAWGYFEGHGIFGTFTEEVKHVMIEGFVDHYMPEKLKASGNSDPQEMDRMDLQAPTFFLDAYFSSRAPNLPPANQVGNRLGGPGQFFEYYANIDQFRGGPIYNIYNAQADIGGKDGAMVRWAGNDADKYLKFFQDNDLTGNMALQFYLAVTDIPDQILEPLGDWLQGDLIEWLTFGTLNCDIGGNLTDAEAFNLLWGYLAGVNTRLDNWKEMAEVVRHNWQKMSECTAENMAKMGGGDYDHADPATFVYTDACAEMARAPWSDEPGATRKSLYRGSIRGARPAEADFLQDLKEGFLGPVSTTTGRTFEQENRHRSIGGNVDRLAEYLYNTSFMLDELYAVLMNGQFEGLFAEMCSMARNTGTGAAKRRCLNLKLHDDMFYLRQAQCAVELAKKEAECYREWSRSTARCEREGVDLCESVPGAYIPGFSFTQRIGWGRFSYKIKIDVPRTKNWTFLTPCYLSVAAGCHIGTLPAAGWCATVVAGWELLACEANAFEKLFTEWDIFGKFLAPMGEMCDYVDVARPAIAEYRQLDTPEKRRDWLKSKGVPLDAITQLKDASKVITDSWKDKPPHYPINAVFLPEDLREDPEYLQVYLAAIEAKIAEVIATVTDPQEQARLVDALETFRTYVEDVGANAHAYYLPYYREDLTESQNRLAPSQAKSELQSAGNALDLLVADAVANPSDVGLDTRLTALEAQIGAIPINGLSQSTELGQKEALLLGVKSLTAYVHSVRTNPDISFNNFPFMPIRFSNLPETVAKEPLLQTLVELGVFPDLPGPTARRLMAEMGTELSEISANTGPEIRTDLFTPYHNTIQGMKLAPVNGKSDVQRLFTQYGLNTADLPWTGHSIYYSEICKDNGGLGVYNLYCDVLKSNDDPDCYGCVDTKGYPYDPALHGPNKLAWLKANLEPTPVSAGGQLRTWFGQRGLVQFNSDRSAPILTNFPLGTTPQIQAALYDNIFRHYPATTPVVNHIYVDDNAAFGGDGTKWESAYSNLQDALDDARNNSGSTTIFVAAGVYRPTYGTAKNATFQIPDNVTLLGGYSGNGQQRDVRVFETRLSGQVGGGISNGASYHVLYSDGASFTLSGFTIEDGNAISGSQLGTGGGGLLVDGNGLTIAISECNFRRNSSTGGGGAVHLSGSGNFVTFESVTFFENYDVGGGGGGALHMGVGNRVSIRESRFLMNSGNRSPGSDIYGEDVDLQIVNAVFDLSRPTEPETKGSIEVSGVVHINHVTYMRGETSFLYHFGSGSTLIENSVLIGGNANPNLFMTDGLTSVTLNHSCVYPNFPSTPWTGSGNTNADPNIPIPTSWPNGTYEPHSPSPVIGTADPATSAAIDVEGNTRDNLPDMGAYEYIP